MEPCVARPPVRCARSLRGRHLRRNRGAEVTITIYPDIPDPRCAIVRPEQRLRIVNSTAIPLQVSLASFQAEIGPGAEYAFELPLGEFLAPGVHLVQVLPCCGPELWLKP